MNRIEREADGEAEDSLNRVETKDAANKGETIKYGQVEVKSFASGTEKSF